MAHTKAQGAVKGNRDSIAKRLGIKLFAGEKAIAGNIIVRQKGNKFFAGKGVDTGNDYTLFATADGVIRFKQVRGKKYVEVLNG